MQGLKLQVQSSLLGADLLAVVPDLVTLLPQLLLPGLEVRAFFRKVCHRFLETRCSKSQAHVRALRREGLGVREERI